MDYVRDLLGRLTVNENGKADKDVLTEFIDTVTVEKDNIFLWGLWLRNKPTYFRMTTQGRGKKMAARCEEGEMSPKSNVPPPKWGKNGRLLSAGCSRDRQTLNTRGANGFSPEKPLFTVTIDASIAREYYKRLGVKFFTTRFNPITMVVYIT